MNKRPVKINTGDIQLPHLYSVHLVIVMQWNHSATNIDKRCTNVVNREKILPCALQTTAIWRGEVGREGVSGGVWKKDNIQKLC